MGEKRTTGFPLKVELTELMLQGKRHVNYVLQQVECIIVNSFALSNNARKVKGQDAESRFSGLFKEIL